MWCLVVWMASSSVRLCGRWRLGERFQLNLVLRLLRLCEALNQLGELIQLELHRLRVVEHLIGILRRVRVLGCRQGVERRVVASRPRQFSATAGHCARACAPVTYHAVGDFLRNLFALLLLISQPLPLLGECAAAGLGNVLAGERAHVSQGDGRWARVAEHHVYWRQMGGGRKKARGEAQAGVSILGARQRAARRVFSSTHT